MPMPNIGDPAPPFSAIDVITGQTYNLADFAKQVVLLIFSGPSWCPPCKLQAPVLQDLWSAFSNSAAPPRVQFLMVSSFDEPEAFHKVVQAFGLTFPALLNQNETITNLYGIVNGPVPTLFVIDTKQKICNIFQGAEGPAGALYKQIYNLLIGCGASAPTPLSESFKIDISKWMAVMTILFGVVQDSGGVVTGPGGEPIPIDPWGPLLRLSTDKKDVLIQLAISELARGVADFKTSSEIETMALKGAETSMKKLVAKNALQPQELDRTFSTKPED